jgi:hypothetical protein
VMWLLAPAGHHLRADVAQREAPLLPVRQHGVHPLGLRLPVVRLRAPRLPTPLRRRRQQGTVVGAGAPALVVIGREGGGEPALGVVPLGQPQPRLRLERGTRDGVDQQEVGLLVGVGEPAMEGAHGVAPGDGRILEVDAVNPAAGAVRDAAQPGLARGGVVVGAGVEGQAGPVEERGSVVEGGVVRSAAVGFPANRKEVTGSAMVGMILGVVAASRVPNAVYFNHVDLVSNLVET